MSKQNALEAGDRNPVLAIATTELSDLVEVLAANIGPRGLYIRDLDRIVVPTDGGLLWKFPALDGESLVPTLHGIVLKVREERAYFRRPFSNTRSRRPPDCASNDALTGIGTPGGDCRTCRLAQFGSGTAGGPACRLFTSLLFLPSDSLLPVIVTVPPMSVQVHEAFVRKLKDAGMGNWDAMIELGLTKTTNRSGMPYARITFRLVRKLDADEIERLRQWVCAVWPPRPARQSGTQRAAIPTTTEYAADAVPRP